MRYSHYNNACERMVYPHPRMREMGVHIGEVFSLPIIEWLIVTKEKNNGRLLSVNSDDDS